MCCISSLKVATFPLLPSLYVNVEERRRHVAILKPNRNSTAKIYFHFNFSEGQTQSELLEQRNLNLQIFILIYSFDGIKLLTTKYIKDVTWRGVLLIIWFLKRLKRWENANEVIEKTDPPPKKKERRWILVDGRKTRGLLRLLDPGFTSRQPLHQKVNIKILEIRACMHKPALYQQKIVWPFSTESFSSNFKSIVRFT